MKKAIIKFFTAIFLLLDELLLIRYPSGDRYPARKASVKFSAFMTGVKGKVGGSVFQGSKVGFTLKNKPSGNFTKAIQWVFGRSYTQATWSNNMASLLELDPGLVAPDGSNSNSGAFYSARSLTSQISKTWQALDSSDRNAWDAAAPSFPFTNKWGEQYTGSGFQVFMSINNKLAPLGVDLLTLPPSPSDGDLPEHTWNTIYLAPESSELNFLQLQIPDGIASGARVVVYAEPSSSAGKLKTVFGGKTLCVVGTEDPSTVELLPLYLILFGTPIIGSAINIKINVVNIANGHSIFTARFQQIITNIVSQPKFQWVYGGIYAPSDSLSLEPSLDWSTGSFTHDFGSVTVDHESDLLGWLIRGLQLTPNETITFTKAGAQQDQFFIDIATNEIPNSGFVTLTADSSGFFGNQPLLMQFAPGSSGFKTCTLTISSPSLTVPIVITLEGTAV